MSAAASDPKWIVQPLIGVVAAIIAGLLAWRSILNTRDIARRKATLDLIEKFESTEHYRALTDAFSKVRKADAFALLVNPAEGTKEKVLRNQVIDYLNHYELVSIGIRNKVLDADIYQEWMRTTFVADWNAAAGWIQARRTSVDAAGKTSYNCRFFVNFQSVATSWSKDATRLHEGAPPPLAHADPPPKAIGPLADIDQ